MADISLDLEAMGVLGPVELDEETQTKAKNFVGRSAKDPDDEAYLLTALGLVKDSDRKPMRHHK